MKRKSKIGLIVKVLVLIIISAGVYFKYLQTKTLNKENYRASESTLISVADSSSAGNGENSTTKTSTATETATITPITEKNEKSQELEKKYQEGYDAFFKGQRDDAIKLENEVIKEDPNFYKAYNLKGIAQCYSGDFNGGMANIDKSLTINPDFGYGRFNKALAYELFGQYNKALEWYDKALQIEKYVWSYYGIASIYGRRGDVDNTVKYLKMAVDMDSSVKEEAKKEEDFNPVKDSKQFKELVGL